MSDLEYLKSGKDFATVVDLINSSAHVLTQGQVKGAAGFVYPFKGACKFQKGTMPVDQDSA